MFGANLFKLGAPVGSWRDADLLLGWYGAGPGGALIYEFA